MVALKKFNGFAANESMGKFIVFEGIDKRREHSMEGTQWRALESSFAAMYPTIDLLQELLCRRVGNCDSLGVAAFFVSLQLWHANLRLGLARAS